MLAKYSGINLKKVNNHKSKSHKIHGKISRLVNSFHNYAIKTCPDDFEVLAFCAEDNEIEAIKHKILLWEGWMWHPEREIVFNEMDIDRFNNIFKSEFDLCQKKSEV